MAEAVRIPKLGLSDYGDLVSWEVAVGERVEAGDVVAVIESDKASAEIEAPVSGTLLEQYVAEGEELAIEVGKPLAAIGEAGESVPALSELEDGGAPAAPDVTGGDGSKSAVTRADDAGDGAAEGGITATPRAKRLANREGVDLGPIDGTGPRGAISEADVEAYLDDGDPSKASRAGDEADVKAMPRARRRAEEAGVGLSGIEGTGPQGAITESDVEAFLDAENSGGSARTDESDTSSSGGDGLTVTESRPLTGTRKTIAERLSESAREKPHVMGTRDIGIERLEEVRDRLAAKRDLDLSLNDLVLHFVGRVLEDLPAFNAHFDDGEHRLLEEVNVGYAVEGERGLVVPVLRDVPGRSLADLSAERRRLVDAVLGNDHTAADLQGGTFTVTNVGVFDMDVSYSIINPPEVAILAMGRRKPVPVERNGEVGFERAITFSLTIDHRVLDGADSGAFLDRLAEYLEFPGRAFDAV
ncbi:2-oxo acid dehydrogenase subunit E2 [Halomarina litorea]|uniref:2-oxo acid dehydrogenase subunit E2 n=1 Tax=Halomarina litorea TaxID=2961595 RepID=UPI0020C35AC5|nr:2-oxo acid dehydrogenase subunit E2 [Halomarina sp. BCD28]